MCRRAPRGGASTRPGDRCDLETGFASARARGCEAVGADATAALGGLAALVRLAREELGASGALAAR